MAGSGGRWSDLTRRVLSAAVLAVAGGVPLLLHGAWLAPAMGLLVTAILAGLLWELERLCAPGKPPRLWVAGAAAMLLWLAGPWHGWSGLAGLAAMLAVLLVGARRAAPAMRRRWDLFAAAFLLAAITLFELRLTRGLMPVLWLVGTVVLSDVLGYFVGRSLGGPKFWPSLSPKKTWSGTVAGWVGAALLGAALAAGGAAAWSAALLGPLVAFAGQMGDIAESALKRRAGVKDSSDLIPGHGGLMDRFDAMTGALILAFLLMHAGLFPRFGG